MLSLDIMKSFSKNGDSTFIHKEILYGENRYHLFSYTIGSFTDFRGTHRRESRGSVFADNGLIISRPFQKFFNFDEHPDSNKIIGPKTAVFTQEKLDGSLISTCYNPLTNEFWLKTKQTFQNPILDDVWEYLKNHKEFLKKIKAISRMGFTVNMEWTTPLNPIVVYYEKPELRVLSVRNNLDGYYILYNSDTEELVNFIPEVSELCWSIRLRPLEFMVELPWVKGGFLTFKNVLESIALDEENFEGFVIYGNGHIFKLKTNSYTAAHACVSDVSMRNISSKRKIAELFLNERLDDIYGFKIVAENQTMREFIDSVVDTCKQNVNFMVDGCRDFYMVYGGLDRKGFAIQAQNCKEIMPVLMSLYNQFPGEYTDNFHSLVVDACRNYLKKQVKKIFKEGLDETTEI